MENYLKQFDIFKDDKKWISEKVRGMGSMLSLASDKFKNDKEIVLLAVKNNGLALEYASAALKSDKDVVMAAVMEKEDAMRLASDILKGDKEFILNLIKKGRTYIYCHVSPKVLEERDVAREVITSNKFIDYSLIPESIKNDKELMLDAVKIKGGTLKSVSERLRGDKDVVRAALNQNGFAIDFATDNIKDDKEFALIALTNKPGSFMFLSERLRDDKELAMLAVKSDGFLLESASERLKNDKEIVLTAIKQNHESLIYASPEIVKLCEGHDCIKLLESFVTYGALKSEIDVNVKSAKIKSKI